MKTTPKDKRGEIKVPVKESVEERVKRHLNDINSVITEDDIRNVTTVLSETDQNANKPETGSKRRSGKPRKQKKENEIDTEIDTNERQSTPWNLLSEGYD